MKHRLAGCAIALACAFTALPAAAQETEPTTAPGADAELRRTPAIPVPVVRLSRDALRSDVEPAQAEPNLDRAARGEAPVIGGLAGAVVGLIAMRLYCMNRDCEMEDLVGILLGAVVGVSIGRYVEDPGPAWIRAPLPGQ